MTNLSLTRTCAKQIMDVMEFGPSSVLGRWFALDAVAGGKQ